MASCPSAAPAIGSREANRGFGLSARELELWCLHCTFVHSVRVDTSGCCNKLRNASLWKW